MLKISQSFKMNFIVLYAMVYASLCVFTLAQRSKNYCSKSLCFHGRHIACGNNGGYSSKCSADSTLIDIAPYQNLILNRHNVIRNRIAAGKLPRFKSAIRMPTIVWDEELAYLASLNVKRCKFEHDDCRNTDRFKNSGQNLGWKWSLPAPQPKETINWSMDVWINEKKDTKMNDIERMSSSANTILHFTLLVSERNNRVGCALLNQTNGGGVDMFFACNYPTTNIYNRPVYRSGQKASKCKSGTNPSYPALCNVGESIDINKT